MRKLLTTLALLLSLIVSAQSKQDRVMLQQITALKTYGNYIKKGYKVVRDGLDLVGKLKEGELSLHKLFFQGLEAVSPAVRNYPKVAGLLELNMQIIALEEKFSRQLDNDLFYGTEKDYIRRVMARVLEGCEDDLEALQAVLSESNLLADDAERLARIDGLFNGMEDRYIFIRAFYNECATLAAARQHESNGIRQSRQLYNINESP